MEDREVIAWFLLDLSPSVDFGTLQNQKRNVLIDFVATLARLLTRHGNRVGAMMFGSAIQRTVPARSGRLQVLRIINDLLNQPRLPHSSMTDLSALLKGGLHAIKKRSLVFVVSDFISTPGWERTLNLLSQHHEVIAIRLWDPREMDLPDIGPIVMEDAETGEQLYVGGGGVLVLGARLDRVHGVLFEVVFRLGGDVERRDPRQPHVGQVLRVPRPR